MNRLKQGLQQLFRFTIVANRAACGASCRETIRAAIEAAIDAMRRVAFLNALLATGLVASLVGCSSEQEDGAQQAGNASWYQPALMVTWQWQLQGTVNTGYDVEIYDIDLFDTPVATIDALKAEGKRVICYFSGGSYEEWRDDAGDFPQAVLGSPLDDWPGERWLDIRAQSVRPIMLARLDLAAEKGCDGVEPDNMDGYLNAPGFALTAADQREYSIFIAEQSHLRGLAVGLKNDLDQVDLLVDYFDFAVNEQCFEFNECDLLQPFIEQGKPVLNAEYSQNVVNNASSRDAVCTDSVNRMFSTLVLPLELDDSFRHSCI